jgi:hypothetical protein
MHGSVPPVHFALSHGARLAYQVWGEGRAIVGIPPLAQKIEAAWEWPAIRTMLERFGAFSRAAVPRSVAGRSAVRMGRTGTLGP